ncbi:aldehyde ferredoxin oxidoreductase family protein [Thermoproteota archaeon]
MAKVKGYAGKVLKVDLSNRLTEEIRYGEDFLRKYLGGTALGAKILYDMVPPKIQFDDPNNIVFIGVGPLTGTNIGGSGSISIVTKGALTGGATSTQANGLFGAYMKFSGYDGLIITGKSEEWQYLLLKDGKPELRNAPEIMGLDTYEVTDKLRDMFNVKNRTASALSIGPAGEKLVRFAGTFVDHGHSASHNGTGAVLGSKRLKAIIAFRGNGRVEIHDQKTLLNISQEMYRDGEYFRGTIGGVANMWKGQSGALPIKNYSTYDWGVNSDEIEGFVEQKLRGKYQIERMPCWGCRLLHSTMFELKEGPYKCMVEEPEYEQMAAWGPLTDISNVEATIMLSGLTDRLGFDNNEAGWLVGWVMEGMEKGWLTEEKVGFKTGFGDINGVERLLRMTASREGFGDILAEGVKRASEKIGGEAARAAAIYTMKGNSPRAHDHRSTWAEMFDTSVSNTGTIETHTSAMSPDAQGPENPMIVSTEVARTKGLMQLEDSAVTCRFNTRMNHKRLAIAISASTGWDMSPEEAWDIGRRAVNLLRAFNLRAGIGKEQDRPSTRYGSTPVDGPTKGIGITPHWNKMLENYYMQMGWNTEGVPTKETLEKLSIGEIWKDLSSL